MAESVVAAALTAPGCIEQAFREVRPPREGEVELRVVCVGVCGSDISSYHGASHGVQYPIVLGHEFSAQIERLGSGVNKLQVGQWVMVAPLLTCGDCKYCSANSEHLCEHRVIFGKHVDGALRERLIMPARTALPLPDTITPQAGTIAEPLAVSIHAVRRVGVMVAGERVVISGAGAIGLLIAQVLNTQGFPQIMLLDIDEERLALAKDLGFGAIHPSRAQPSSADLLFIATGSPEAIHNTPELLAPRGFAVVVGIMNEVLLDWTALLMKEAAITTSRYFTMQDYEDGVRLLSTGAISTASLITDTAQFSELFVDTGQSVMERAKQAVRLLIEM
ncbi:MAG: alcohol dehydrogenase catalytic domain-containing protein [Anaerolineales bacterium]